MSKNTIHKSAPTQWDAEMLLKLNEIQQSDRIFKGWAFSQFDFKSTSWKDLQLIYPRGSAGFDYFYAVGHFLELCGVLLKHGLLSEDLFFDTFYFEPIWKNFEPVIKSMRKELNEPTLEENFEYLYNRYVAWKKERKTSD
ncbi:MAG: DUF4760 domain-containing protein [Thaumarchaeota archaeon]|nr:DUF4760 domain-containing protein [Nitrososphaerota archaeon]